jgi:hemerythrin superfamily protein
MHALLNKLSPSATDMIRADHTRVLGSFHRFAADARPATKQALVNMICTSLQIHAQLEEEIFYPAMRGAGSALLNEFEPEHEEMRSLIATLSGMKPTDEQYDQTFMELMRTVIHHVADEETMLLPNAEAVLGDELGQLGRDMMKRRLQLTAPRAGEIARDTARAKPNTLLFGAGALIAAAYLFRSLGRRHAVR